MHSLVQQKRWKGCARLFQPMYAEANMGPPSNLNKSEVQPDLSKTGSEKRLLSTKHFHESGTLALIIPSVPGFLPHTFTGWEAAHEEGLLALSALLAHFFGQTIPVESWRPKVRHQDARPAILCAFSSGYFLSPVAQRSNCTPALIKRTVGEQRQAPLAPLR
jgi:hypothetical protein